MVVKPIVTISGARIPAVVVMATVLLPCAVLRITANRKGMKQPRVLSAPEFWEMKLTISVEAITFPRTPPPAVTNRIFPDKESFD